MEVFRADPVSGFSRIRVFFVSDLDAYFSSMVDLDSDFQGGQLEAATLV